MAISGCRRYDGCGDGGGLEGCPIQQSAAGTGAATSVTVAMEWTVNGSIAYLYASLIICRR